MTPRRQLILPVEVSSREWDAKLLLACSAAERGFPVIIGCHARINQRIYTLPRSIYIAKGVTRRSRRMFEILKRLGHTVVAWDEEGLIYMKPEFYLNRKVFGPSMALTATLFAWGPENAALWRGAPFYDGVPIHPTGNPRIDLMRPELRGYFADDAARLRERFGRYILINTNFGWVNHFLAELGQGRNGAPEPGTVVREDQVGSKHDPYLSAYRYQILKRFLAVVPTIARRFADRKVIIRPHPSESHQAWRDAGAGFDNVIVIHEGNVIPWLMAADVNLHNGCTTGFESSLLDRPTIAYRPLSHADYDIPLPNAVSRAVETEAALLEAIEEAVTDDFELEVERQALVRDHLAALDGPLAIDRIMDVIEGLEPAGRPAFNSYLGGQLRARARRAEKIWNGFVPGHHNNRTYIGHRFPDKTTAEVAAEIDRFQGVLGRFAGTRVEQLKKNIFQITARPS